MSQPHAPTLAAATLAPKWVYSFGGGKAEGSAAMREILGGKGANLAEMANLGLPVPPGFTISTHVCEAYYQGSKTLPETLRAQVEAALGDVGELQGAKLGETARPLLVSVRSGARASMPGMMDTILNLGLNDQTVEGLAALSQDRRFAYDSYRRFIQMYSDVVLGVPQSRFESLIEHHKGLAGVENDTDLGAEDWHKLIAEFKSAVHAHTGQAFPQDTALQLWGAIGAVFASWQTPRAQVYRRMHEIPDAWGTAVTVQAMVFGNRGRTSATGVAFTRNPSHGSREIYGEYLLNAQGEDVVAGLRTPHPLSEAARREAGERAPSLETVMPESYAELISALTRLEAHYRDMQDVEFTIEDKRLFMLQTRSGKRTTVAAIKIAVDMANEGLITKSEAVARIEPDSLDQLLHPSIDPDAPKTILARGLAASPGAAVGSICLDPDQAETLKSEGKSVILVRAETSPEDIHGMIAAAGILTQHGGLTSHAAVVARGMGRPCVSGAGTMRINAAAQTVQFQGRILKAGDTITIDGSTGEVMLGAVAMREPELSGDFATLMTWADGVRRLKVRANADTPRDATEARRFGAEGIGLCRTEHMFFEPARLLAMREMILALDLVGRERALAKVLDLQRADFEKLFEIMAPYPVTVRLLDPPLHEFLPKGLAEIASVAAALDVPVARVEEKFASLHEQNPMLGFRGCRLGLVYPEITRMQARALFEAASLVQKRGLNVAPEIMVPLVAYRAEFDAARKIIDEVAGQVAKSTGVTLAYQVGTMIELPRAALQAAQIASGDKGAEFFSFGTNDLTQTTLGLSRDDAGPILSAYEAQGIVTVDPFSSIDVEGVGELVQIASERGRKARPGLKLGICGEHGGDPRSIAFFEDAGLDYVSCSPFRVPIARLAAAHAAINSGTASSKADRA